ncbi:MAG: VCBS repeat-containing protein, partial [Moraxellaceae bacterium]|nr:VCBS repeat-containing protein [Moraxellaceae bacterium]
MSNAPFAVGTGHRIYDVNGDGLPDMVFGGYKFTTKACASCSWTTTYYEPEVFINNGYTYEKNAAISTFLKNAGIFFRRRITEIANGTLVLVQDIDPVDVADVNGDGYMDLVFGYQTAVSGIPAEELNTIYLYNPTTQNYVLSTRTVPAVAYSAVNGKRQGVRWVDINGDNIDDIVYLYRQGASSYQGVLLNNGTSFDGSSAAAISYNSSVQVSNLFENTWSTTAETSYGTRIVDINGDGLPDILQLFSNGATKINRVFLNNPATSSFVLDATYSASVSTVFMASYNGTTLLSGSLRLLDLNGDGLLDIVMSGQVKEAATTPIERHIVLLNSGKKFVADIGYTASAFLSGGLYFSNSTTFSFFGKKLAADVPLPDGMDNGGGVSFVDMNGDGLLDQVKVVYTYSSSQSRYNKTFSQAWLNDGTKFVSAGAASATYFSMLPGYISCSGVCEAYRTVRYADLNGDGAAELYAQYENNPWLLNGLHVVHTRRLSALKSINSVGRKVDIEYALNTSSVFSGSTSTSGSHLAGAYRNNTGTDRVIPATETYRFWRSPNLFVALIKEQTDTKNASGEAQEWVRTILWKNPIIDKRGRGFLGLEKQFETIEVVGEASKIITGERHYNTAFPYSGMTAQLKKRVNGKRWLEESSTLQQQLRGASVFPFVQSTVHTSLDPFATVDTVLYDKAVTYTHDAWGNLQSLQSVVTDQDGTGIQRTVGESFTYYPLIQTADRWEPGLLRSRSKTESLTGAPAATTTAAYTYDDKGRIYEHFIEPNLASAVPVQGSQSTSYKTTYGRDLSANGFGLVAAEELMASAPANQFFPVPITAPVRRKTTFEYDPSRRFVTQTSQFPDALQPFALTTKATEHDFLHGQPKYTNDFDDRVTTHDHDVWGRKTAITRPDGSADEWLYQACVLSEGCSFKVTSRLAGSPEQVAYFDKKSRQKKLSVAQQVSGQYSTSFFEYDGHGRLRQRSRPALAAPTHFFTYEFDALDRETKELHPNGRVVSTSYVGKTKKSFDSAVPNIGTQGNGCGNTVLDQGETRRERRTAEGQLLSVTDACGAVTTYAPYPGGLNKSITNTKGQMREWMYDAYGRMTQETSLDSGVTTFNHDVLGNIIRRVNQDQKATINL